MKTALSPDGKYGLYDVEGRCWLGGESGPNRYEDFDMARCAATIASEQLDTRIRAMEIPPDPFRFKDEVPTLMTPEQAIKNIEGKAR